jgi:hypothetical protein
MIITNDKKYTPAKTAFGNAGLNTAMNFFATNQALGASATDMGFMVIPRTAVDMTRTPEAGIETGRRELASCLLYACMGFFGVGAAMTVGAISDVKKYGKDVYKIPVGSQAVETLGSAWNDALDKHGRELGNNKDKVVKEYVNSIFDSVSGIDGDKATHINSNPELKQEIIDKMHNMLINEKGFKVDKKEKDILARKIIKATSSGEHLTLNIKGQEPLKLSAKDLIDNTYSLGRAFMQDEVAKEFKNTKNITDNQFVKSFKKFNRNKMVLGLGVASALGAGMQALNRYMTKKKTGSDGFCVYKDNNGQKAQRDDSLLFKMEKGAAAIGMALFAATSIVSGEKVKGATKGFVSDTLKKFKTIPKKLEFTKVMPNMNQYKYIYGVTIMGRMLAASDQNELRETTTRDILGFTSWLILGDVVAKAIGRAFEKKHNISLLNYHDKNANSGMQKLMHSSIKTHEEILYSAKSDNLNKSVKEASKAAGDGAKKALKYLNIAQLGGYAASGLVLGVGIPLLNKFITNKLHEKKLEKTEPNYVPPQNAKSSDKKLMENKVKQNKTFVGFTKEQ